MRLQATAPLVVAQMQDGEQFGMRDGRLAMVPTPGAYVHVYKGDLVPPQVLPSHAAHLLAMGLVIDLDAPGPTIEDDVRAELAASNR